MPPGRTRIASLGSLAASFDVIVDSSNATGTAFQATTEVLAAIVATHRRLDPASSQLRTGTLDWGARVGVLRGHEVRGTVLGIVGYFMSHQTDNSLTQNDALVLADEGRNAAFG